MGKKFTFPGKCLPTAATVSTMSPHSGSTKRPSTGTFRRSFWWGFVFVPTICSCRVGSHQGPPAAAKANISSEVKEQKITISILEHILRENDPLAVWRTLQLFFALFIALVFCQLPVHHFNRKCFQLWSMYLKFGCDQPRSNVDRHYFDSWTDVIPSSFTS